MEIAFAARLTVNSSVTRVVDSISLSYVRR